MTNKRGHKPGTLGTMFTRLRGPRRHVTVYPPHNRCGTREVVKPEQDITLPEADVLAKTLAWARTDDYTELEPGVFLTRVVKE